MDINLDDLLGTLEPDPIVIKIGGSSFAVSDLTVGQVLKLSRFGDTAPADSAQAEKDAADKLEFVASLFKGKAPPQFEALKASIAKGDRVRFVDRQRVSKEVSLIVAAVQAGCNEVASSKKVVAAAETIAKRLAATSDSSPD